MLTAISPGAMAAPQASAPATPTRPTAAPSPASPSRTTAQASVTISSAGQHSAQSAGDLDHDGDSH